MKHTGITGLIFGCTKVCLILAIEKTISIQRKPYGPKMCKQFCDLAGCSSKYTFLDLSCNATFHKGSTTARKYVVIERSMDDALKHQDLMGVSSVTTTAASLNLLSGDERKISSKNKTVQNLGMGLLVAPVHGSRRQKKNPLLHISLYNYTIKPFLGLSTERVSALAYTSKYEIVFLGTKKPDHKIVAFNVNTQRYVTIANNTTTGDMSFDEATEQLFFTTDNPGTGVNSIPFDGKKFSAVMKKSSIVRRSTCANAITLDRKQKIVYASCSQYIFRVSYNGENYKVIMGGSLTSALTIDETSEGFYFNRRHDICYVLLGKGNHRRVVKLKRSPSNIVLHENTLYASSSTTRDIFVISLMDKKVKEIDLQLHRGHWIQMCLFNKPTNP